VRFISPIRHAHENIEELLKSKRQEILAIAAKHGASNLRVFGFVAGGEAGPESDLDILVEMEPGPQLQSGSRSYKRGPSAST
jgi:predicted nucleotidyltransferase